MQRLVLEKLKMERTWQEKRGTLPVRSALREFPCQVIAVHYTFPLIWLITGVKRFEAGALLIQRVFRGFWIRKRM